MPNVKVDLFADYQRKASGWARANALSGNLKIKGFGKQQDRVESWLRAHSFGSTIENMHQRIEARPRKVHLCENFIVPDECKKDVESIFEIVRSGGDLTQFLGNNIRKLGATDNLLNVWGIFHFHMKPFQQRIPGEDNSLLFAYVTDDAFYVVGFGGHDCLHNTDIIKTLQRECPHAFPECSEDAVADVDSNAYACLRKNNINAIVSVNGVACLPAGGGVNFNGESTKAYCEMVYLRSRFDKFSKILQQRFLLDIRGFDECHEDSMHIESVSLRLLNMTSNGLVLDCPELGVVVAYRIENEGLRLLSVCTSGQIC